MKKFLLILPLLVFAAPATAQDRKVEPLLLQKPTVNRTHIVFSFADDLWNVAREGGTAQRLTSAVGVETDPIYSPGGKQIAFTGQYEGNTDVYIMPAEGGIPRRLTWHPGTDQAVGWTPDGKRVLFRSTRKSYSRFIRLFTVPVAGGFPEEVPLPMAYDGTYSPKGNYLAYAPLPPAFRIWDRYRGGMASYIWIARLNDSSIEKIPRKDSNDHNPMWFRDSIYFLSDRNGPMSLFAYDLKGKKVRQVLDNSSGMDLKSASAGPDVIVYEQFGSICLFNPSTEKSQRVPIAIKADLPTVRPRFVDVSKKLGSPALSPTGVRAVFEARGEILTVPTKKGNVRNLTNTPGTAERDPVWSPNGKWIAYFSDACGDYELHIRNQSGMGKVKKYKLAKAPAFYYSPSWSPDSKKITYSDCFMNLWYLDLDKGESVLVDTSKYAMREFDHEWSPDSRWLVYTKPLKNTLRAAYVYSMKTGKKHRITDGTSDVRYPTFDQSGKYLYFTVSTDIGPTTGGIEMSNFNVPVTRSVHLLVLRKDLPSPLAPESDEEVSPEKAKDKKDEGKNKKKAKKGTPKVRIDFENIDQRILALPVPVRNYVGLISGKAGVLFVAEKSITPVQIQKGPSGVSLSRFDIEKRKLEPMLKGISSVTISHDRKKLLVKEGKKWEIYPEKSAAKGGGTPLKTANIEVRIDPRAEWKQMYHEVWRIERDFLYDPNYHGLDLKATEQKYLPYLKNIASRRDLNYLFGEMLSELTLGHVYVFGGDTPDVDQVKGGLLGADFRIENSRYRFARIYHGDNWDPGTKAPLTQPGVNVKKGDYLLAVNGREVKAPDNVYKFFEGTAGKTVILRIGPRPNGKDAREVKVVPIASDSNLRNRAWIEENRKKVDRMTKGKVAYVYLPNTHTAGYTAFNREYFAQVGKKAVIIDERFNGGGKAADYIVHRLNRPLLNYWALRKGAVIPTPTGAIFGPKVMIINEMAGSGGDLMPWYFRRLKLGKLVGKRTWGGLVGIGGYPTLIDGGTVTAPHFAFFSPEGKWEVENHGVDPDVEVEYDPKLWREGHDPQLERAVRIVLRELENYPQQSPNVPAYPKYQRGRRSKKGSAAGGTQ